MKRLNFCFLILSLIFFNCCAAVDLSQEVVATNDNLLYSAVAGKTIVPPTNFKVDIESSDYPTLSWKPNANAFCYRVYRKASTESDWQLLCDEEGNSDLKSDSYVDYSLNKKAIDSSIYFYAISSVSEFNREGFKSNGVSVVFDSPAFDCKVTLNASYGFYESVGEIEANKGAILLSFDASSEIAAVALFRQMEGGEKTLIADNLVPTQIDGKYYITDCPLTVVDENEIALSGAGFDYSYWVVPINSDGKYGKQSEVAVGRVFAAPVLKGIKVDGQNATVYLDYSEKDKSYIKKVVIEYNEETTGEWKKIECDNTNSEISLSEHAKTFLNDKLACSLFFRTYVVYEKEGKEFSSPVSSLRAAKFLADEIKDLPLVKSVTVTHGKKAVAASEVTSPITLSWNKPSGNGDKIVAYNIYRADAISITSLADNSNWEFIDSVKTENGKNSYTFSDKTVSAFGAYYYQIKTAFATEYGQDLDNNALASIVKAAIVPEDFKATASLLEFSDKIAVEWDSIYTPNNSLYYKVEYKLRSQKSFKSQNSYVNKINIPVTHTANVFDFAGTWDIKVTPVVNFTNIALPISSVNCDSSTTAGAVTITDLEWARYVMKTIVAGQKLVTPAERQKSAYTSGGIDYTKTVGDSTVEYKRRSYYSSNENEKYDVYNFTSYKDVNEGISITGALYHLYFKGTNSWLSKYNEDIPLSFSSNVFSLAHNSDDDKIAKTQGEIKVEGLYSGVIQCWFKNNGYDKRNDASGSLPIGDYIPSNLYTNANKDKLNWFSDSYGLKVLQDSKPSINKATAYSIKRDEATSYKNLTHTQVGALQ